MESLLQYISNVWATTLELSLWLLLGLLIAGILHVFVSDKFIIKHLGSNKGFISIFKAVLFGVPMPLCSCGVIPAALGIKKQGAGDGAAIGFLISTPQTGVDSIMVSASMLGFPFAIFKVISAFLIGLFGGSWAQFTENSQNTISPKTNDDDTPEAKRDFNDIFKFAIDDLLKMIWKWLVIGILVSSALTTFLPANFFQNYLPDNELLSMLVALIISLPMYVCATASVPVAAALIHAGMPTGAALVFLMAGPASNIATIGAVYRAFGLKKLMIYLTSIAVGSIISGILFDKIITNKILMPQMIHHSSDSLLKTISAIVLLLLIARFLFKEIRYKLKELKSRNISKNMQKINLKVTGMKCKNCVSHLKEELLILDGIATVDISLETSSVVIEGQEIELSLITEIVAKQGYKIINP
jgi:uncharacterized membrane protein YraQ (UPF0718 family)/copper chaperone CopZ